MKEMRERKKRVVGSLFQEPIFVTSKVDLDAESGRSIEKKRLKNSKKSAHCRAHLKLKLGGSKHLDGPYVSIKFGVHLNIVA